MPAPLPHPVFIALINLGMPEQLTADQQARWIWEHEQSLQRRIASLQIVHEADQSYIESVVSDVSDRMKWNWTRAVSLDHAANEFLLLMHRVGLIEHRDHPSGGHVWRCNGNLFGRTDGIDDFDKIGCNCPVLDGVKVTGSSCEVHGFGKVNLG